MTRIKEDKIMSNWSYGNGVLPSEHIKESQDTGKVKAAIKALESTYAVYNGYMTKAKAGSADGSITDQKSYQQAVQSLDKLGQAITNVKQVLTAFQKGLVTGNKKLGGGLNQQVLDNLIKTCESKFNEIKSKMAGGAQSNEQTQNQNAQQNTQQQSNQQNAQNNLQQIATALQSATPEQLQQIVQILGNK